MITRYILIILTIFTVNNVYAQTAAQNDQMLLGEISKSDLLKPPYAQWYHENESAYQVDGQSMMMLTDLLKDVEVKVVMGTWCHDSKREVPRLYKILASAGAENNAQMVAIDRSKQAPNGEIDGLGITNTPTFIFMKDGVEVNRIVETPVESLEKDMLRILKGENYRHSKMAE